MSNGITNATIATTDIKETTITPAPDPADLPDPQEDMSEEDRIAYIKRGFALNDRLGEESKASLKKSAKVAFQVGQVLHYEHMARGTEAAVGDWAKKNGIKWTRGREALRLFWRCDTPEKRAELPNLTITQARRKYQVRYAQFIEGRYTTKPDAPAVDRLQNALLKLTAILDDAKPDDWNKGKPNIGTVTAQIDDVMEKLTRVKKIINAEPETAKGSRRDDAEKPEKKTRRQKVGDEG